MTTPIKICRSSRAFTLWLGGCEGSPLKAPRFMPTILKALRALEFSDYVGEPPPDKAYASGTSFSVATPPSGPINPLTDARMRIDAEKKAKESVRAYFKSKKPVRCVGEIKINYDEGKSRYELRHMTQGKQSLNYYTFKMAWLDASCHAPGRLASTGGLHLFMVENAHSELFK